MNNKPNELSIYIHWPFCKTKCPYCDFNSHEDFTIQYDSWKKAYLNEIDLNKDIIKGKKIKSIFFGGGTPSLMSSHVINAILNKLSNLANFSNNVEITLEANPSSIERANFKDFKYAGINRMSVGIQSFNNDNLKFLGRSHSSYDGLKAIEFAREVFDNYSFDLMYCLPNQRVDEWERELNEAIRYIDYHISCYQLTIEKGTQFFNAVRAKKIQIPNEDIAIKMYEATYNILKLYGVNQYEVSNYSKPGYECKHNLSYWKLDNYIGIGPGAHGRYASGNEIYYTINYYDPKKWFDYTGKCQSPIQSKKEITDKQHIIDSLTMGLRLNQGMHQSTIPNLVAMNYLITKGFLSRNKNKYIKSTLKGRLVLNAVIKKLLAT